MPQRAHYPDFSALKLPRDHAASPHRSGNDDWQMAERAERRWQIALVAALAIIAVGGVVLIILGLTG